MVALTMKPQLGVSNKKVSSGDNMCGASSYTEIEEQILKRARLSREEESPDGIPTMVPERSQASPVPVAEDNEETPGSKSRMGRWSLDEKIMFLYGLSLYGKGRWKKIHAYVPDR